MSADVLQCYSQDGTMKAFDDRPQGNQELETSFSVRLLPTGFSIRKPLEKGKALPSAAEATDLLYPYDRTSEFFLRALDSGCIPAKLLDGIPCKYVNGCVECEVIDYCVNAPTSNDNMLVSNASIDWPPVLYRITLQPTMESIVKDVSSMVDENWTYTDLMEVESRILKTVRPQLNLDIKPNSSQVENKAHVSHHLHSSAKIFRCYQVNKRALLNRRLRLAASTKAMVKASVLDHNKRVCFGIIPERLTGQPASEATANEENVASVSAYGSATQELILSSKSSVLGKRDYQQALDSKVDSLSDYTKLDSLYQKDLTLEQRRSGESASMSPNMQAQSWQVVSPPLTGDSKQDELLQRSKSLASPKLSGRTSTASSFSNDMLPLMMSQGGAIHPVVGSSIQPSITPSSSSCVAQQDKSGLSGPMDPILLARRKLSLPKSVTSVAGVGSPCSTGNSGGISNIDSPSSTSIPPVPIVKNETSLIPGQRKEPIDNLMAIMSVAWKYGIATKKRKIEQLPEVERTSPSWQLLIVAFANSSIEDMKDLKGEWNMADSLVGGNVNARKTRVMQFQRQLFHGTDGRHVRVHLVMCERGKDAMVEAVIQFGDDQENEIMNAVPHHVLPTMANAHAADRFAKQFCTVMEKEGFDLLDDQVHPAVPRGNAPPNVVSTTRPLQAGVSTLGNSIFSLASSRPLVHQHLPTAMGGVGGLPGMSALQQPAQAGLAVARMPPPGNRQLSGSYLGQAGVNNQCNKPLQLEGAAAQLGGVQHIQPPLTQRAQPMVMQGQVPQLSPNPLNSQLVTNQGQIQQFLQHQQCQQAQNVALQRRLMGMGSLGTIGGLGGVGIPVSGAPNQGGLGNMVGMNNVIGMGGMNGSASMGLNNVGHMSGIVMGQNQGLGTMGQNAGLNNLIGQQIRPSSLHQMAALTSKAAQGQGGGGGARDNFTAMNATNHMSAGLPMLNQSLSRVGRVGLTPIQRPLSTPSFGSPKVATASVTAAGVTGQNLYMSPQQQVPPLSATSLQILGSQTPLSASPQMLNSQQPMISQSQQSIMNPQGSMSSASQQLSNQSLVVGGLGSIVGGPASPQLSSQSLGSVTGASLDPPIPNQGVSLPSSG